MLLELCRALAFSAAALSAALSPPVTRLEFLGSLNVLLSLLHLLVGFALLRPGLAQGFQL